MFSITDLIPSPYKILAEFVIGVSLIAGAYFYGHHEGNLESRVAIANFATAKAKSDAVYELQIDQAKNNILVKYVDQYHTTTETHYVNQQAIENSVPDKYILTNGWVSTHDHSATDTAIDSTAAADATPSGVTADQALTIIDNNYAKCRNTASELTALQDLVTAHNTAAQAANQQVKK